MRSADTIEAIEHVPGVDNPCDSTVPMPFFDGSVVDKEIKIGESEAIDGARELHRKKYYVGISTGAVFFAAKKVAETEGGNAVMNFVDRGDRYTHLLVAENRGLE